jgi:S1-C subfamily serine protease
MNEVNNTYDQIERYSLGLMSIDEKKSFEIECNSNNALKQAVIEYNTLISSMDHMQNSEWVANELRVLHTANKNTLPALTNYLKLHVSKYWRTASVAASVALVASMFSFLMARNVYKKDTALQNKLLVKVSREINDIKKNQKNITTDLNKVKSIVPDAPSKFMGTTFAISNDGYFITNKHVIEGGNKLFIFTNDNTGHQAKLIDMDEENDIALLKIDEENFTLSKNPIPYSVKGSRGSLAQKVYTIGFPKNEIVYSEGYISSINGENNDSSKFQLELPSAPGISGAPLFDELGNVIGIVNSKQDLTEATTYAIKSGILTKLLNRNKVVNLSKLATSSIRQNTRTEQIKMIQPYVCVVKVYN